MESEADRLASIKALGGEPFSTGRPDKLWAIFDREFQETVLETHVVANRRPVLLCRASDVALHGLIKDSAVTRDADGKKFYCKDFEDDGVGMTVIPLKA